TRARIKKKSKTTSGEIQRICFYTCITRPNCAQLILRKMSRTAPSIRPVTIPNQIGIKSSEVADALPLEDSACVSGDKMALYFMHSALQVLPAYATCSHTS